MNITGTTATGGGNVIWQGESSVTALGVCWSTIQNPTISDAHTTDGAGTGSFVSQITGLTTVTSYYVRAYATNSFGTAYGNEILFSTPWEPCQTVPIVNYDGQIYNTVQIGYQCWMAENLNIGTMIPGTSNMANNGVIEKYCYNNTTANCNTYGGLYQWNEMMAYTTQQGTSRHLPYWLAYTYGCRVDYINYLFRR